MLKPTATAAALLWMAFSVILTDTLPPIAAHVHSHIKHGLLVQVTDMDAYT
jgi:hypothetical protein